MKTPLEVYEALAAKAKSNGICDMDILEELKRERESVLTKSIQNQVKVTFEPNPYLKRALRKAEVECISALNEIINRYEELINGTNSNSRQHGKLHANVAGKHDGNSQSGRDSSDGGLHTSERAC